MISLQTEFSMRRVMYVLVAILTIVISFCETYVVAVYLSGILPSSGIWNDWTFAPPFAVLLIFYTRAAFWLYRENPKAALRVLAMAIIIASLALVSAFIGLLLTLPI